jgi:hypothetical protein
MHTDPAAPPEHYRATIRTLLRFSMGMVLFGLLCGVLFQESSKQLSHAQAPNGLYLEALLSLALVHGHVLVSGTLLPIALAGALTLARRAGAGELAPRTLLWLTRGYLPCVTLSLLLMLYKGYHTLISVRLGRQDLTAIDAAYFGGQSALRHGVYAVAHIGMALGLGVFAVALWRSLSARPRTAPPA